jgi:hypothetical protein
VTVNPPRKASEANLGVNLALCVDSRNLRLRLDFVRAADQCAGSALGRECRGERLALAAFLASGYHELFVPGPAVLPHGRQKCFVPAFSSVTLSCLKPP